MIRYSSIMRICVLYMITWLISPPLAYGTIYRMIALAAAGVWVLLHLVISDKEKKTGSKILQSYLIAIIAYVALTIFLDFVFGKKALSNIITSNISTYILLFMGYIAGYYATEKETEELNKFLFWILFLAVFFSLTTIFRSEEFQKITRSAGGFGENTELKMRAAAQGVGDFGFFSATSVLAPVALYLAIKNEKKRGWFAASFVILELGVISGGFTLALTISLIGILICLLVAVKNILLKVLFALLCIFVLLFYEDVLMFLYEGLAKITDGTMYENKVYDIFSFLIEGESTGSFDDRAERYVLSLNSLWRYPIFGSYIWDGTESTGRHSAIIDRFAAYGWLVGFLWLYIIVAYPNKLAGLQSTNKWPKLMVLLCVVLTAVFNQYAMHMGIFCFVLPAVASYAARGEVLKE